MEEGRDQSVVHYVELSPNVKGLRKEIKDSQALLMGTCFITLICCVEYFASKFIDFADL